jgi:16S rRNA (cytidine1402-2'-O)-methyltransferase
MISDKGKNELNQGKIYVVSTPIGNLEDITLRALRVLKEVGLIAAESRDHTKKLCGHYNIRTPITSYNSHNQHYKGRVLLEKVKSGLDIALVSDAGTPGLSDPGSRFGFLSNKKGRRRKELEGLKGEWRTMIFFESPHRLFKMLTDIYEILGDRDIALAKEMTKIFEDVKRESVKKLLSLLKDEKIRGEYTVIVEGLKESKR